MTLLSIKGVLFALQIDPRLALGMAYLIWRMFAGGDDTKDTADVVKELGQMPAELRDDEDKGDGPQT